MTKIGIFYGGSPKGSTFQAAQDIVRHFGEDVAAMHNVSNATREDLEKCDYLILGTSAWGIGEMHQDWERFIDVLVDAEIKDKKIALFGLGDQHEYPESFVDGMGTVYCRLPYKENVVGFWPTKGYSYYFSTAERDGKFVGLAIDEDSQPELTSERISKWVEQLKTELL
ncbi:MAG: flavodoxin [Lentimicrobiaceae bacterium]|nr:flavodoxin [Lentimicrobiaceae bacterium]MCB9023127.1 flavodoxin [Lentimicrobiaceae bacterium]MCO5264652.1 flavodoxin [Lentimicrobium sp.]